MFHSHEEIEFIVQNDDKIHKDDVNRILKALGRTELDN